MLKLNVEVKGTTYKKFLITISLYILCAFCCYLSLFWSVIINCHTLEFLDVTLLYVYACGF